MGGKDNYPYYLMAFANEGKGVEYWYYNTIFVFWKFSTHSK
jgi:hypothetical protein